MDLENENPKSDEVLVMNEEKLKNSLFYSLAAEITIKMAYQKQEKEKALFLIVEKEKTHRAWGVAIISNSFIFMNLVIKNLDHIKEFLIFVRGFF